jgi:hypothetical protein
MLSRHRFFVALFYHDIKRRYTDPSNGKKDQRRIRNDIKRLFTAYSISDAVYFVGTDFSGNLSTSKFFFGSISGSSL